MTRILAALAAMALTAIVFVLAVYGPQWIFQAPFIHDLSIENVRAHGIPGWWHPFNVVLAVCIVGGALLKRRAKRRRKKLHDR